MRRKNKKKHEAKEEGIFKEDQQDSTAGLIPVPQQKSATKFLWAIPLALAVLLLVWHPQNQTASQIVISSQKDKFKIDLKIQERDRQTVDSFLQKLQAPQDILAGTQFTLDATSSAKLAFATPIELNLKFKKDSIYFSGQSHTPLVQASLPSPTGFKIPSGANLVLFGQNFKTILKGDKIVAALSDSQSGQYLILTDDSFSLSFKPLKPVDFSKLQEIAGKENYKQETDSDVTIHLVKISGAEETLAFFEMGEWVHVTSSLESAKNILVLQKGEAPYINFPKTDEQVSLAIYYKKQQSPSEKSLNQILTNGQKFAKYLENVKEVLIILNQDKISGYINF